MPTPVNKHDNHMPNGSNIAYSAEKRVPWTLGEVVAEILPGEAANLTVLAG
jgi:hypothetical protein